MCVYLADDSCYLIAVCTEVCFVLKICKYYITCTNECRNILNFLLSKQFIRNLPFQTLFHNLPHLFQLNDNLRFIFL